MISDGTVEIDGCYRRMFGDPYCLHHQRKAHIYVVLSPKNRINIYKCYENQKNILNHHKTNANSRNEV
jgi:hypothetical protein